MSAPALDTVMMARTLTPSHQRVRILVTAIIERVPSGWIVGGIRIGRSSRRRVGGLMTAREYLVRDEEAAA